MASKTENKYRKQIVSFIKRTAPPCSKKDIRRALKVTKKHSAEFENAINFLLHKNQIKQDSSNQNFSMPAASKVVSGELRLTKGGFGFVRDENSGLEIFINRDHLNTAFDKDIVEAKLYARRRGKNQEGFVTKIVKRYRKNFVGTFHITDYYGFVVPDDPRVYRDFFIPTEKYSGVKDGQKVLVAMEKWDTDHLNPEGGILEIIGYPGEPGVDVAAIAHSFNIPVNFPQGVENEAKKIPSQIDPAEIKKRLDLRKKEIFTIDPEDAKDFDDAVSLEKLENGNYLLGVHIADVSYYVTENSRINKEAFKRGTSVYLVDRVLSMLPEVLSNNLCSLQEKKDKLTYSCIMELSPRGSVINYKIEPSIINSKKRFNYQEVQDIIDNNVQIPFSETLAEMMNLGKILTSKRFDEGGIDFETPEVSFILDEKGFPVDIKRKERLDSHRLIEEFMLLANRTVATHIQMLKSKGNTLPFIYRIHDKPDKDKMKIFFEFLHALGIKFQPVKKITSGYFQKLLKSIKGSKEEFVIEEVALRSMMKAVYVTKNVGHFGLGFDNYTHFTSPIRRYPDLVVHRLLREYRDLSVVNFKDINERLNGICEHSNIKERTALEAERESIKQKKIEYISQKVGEKYKGIISGVMSFGIFVELTDTLVEGLIHIKNLDDDYYIHDEKTYSLIGRDTDRTLRLGDEIDIQIANVNIEEGKVDFTLLK